MPRTRTRNRPLALWRRSPPWVKRSAVTGAVLLLLWAVALAVANRPSARQRLSETIREAVERRLSGAEIGESVSIDPLFRVTFGPLTVRAERKGAPPILHAERVKVRADWGALFAGRIEPASIRLYGVRIEPGERLGELRELAERLQSRPDGKRTASIDLRQVPRDWPAIHLRGAVVALHHAGRTIEIGPLDLAVLRRRRPNLEKLEISLSHREGGRLELELHRGGEELRLSASASDVGPGVLPPSLANGSVRWTGGTLSGELSLAGKNGSLLTGRVHGRIDRVRFSGERLSPEPVGPVTIDLDGALEADLADRRLALRDGVIHALGSIDATLQAEARFAPGLPFAVSLEVPELEYGALVSALPAPFQPPADAPHPSGHLSFHFGLAGPLSDPATWTVEADLDLSTLRDAAKRDPPVSLRAPFTWRPEVASGEAPTIVVGPGNSAFVPIAELPEYVVRAVTTSEDAGFFAHPGFDFDELRNAFAQGAEAGRVVRGASTITQQLAKNLFLSRERTLSRKAREAMVAIALEATVPKPRLLEIYLNIAEWGPGLWGMGPAAQHYFGKPARELTPREAVFLASIIPNPVRYHGYYERGELDEAWTERLRTILLHMAQAGVLTEEQLAEALDAPLAFARPTPPVDPASVPLPVPAPEP